MAPACQPGGTTTDPPTTGTGDSGSSGTATTLDTTASTIVDTSSESTTGPVVCDENDGEISQECEDADAVRPYCVGGGCVSCDEAGAASFCGGVDPLTPACDLDTGLCQGCTDAETPVCEGSTPVCDASGECLGCSAHSECPDSACHLDDTDPLQGSCFAEDEVIWVEPDNACPGDGSEGDPFCSLANTLFNIVDDVNVVVMLDGGNVAELVTYTADSTLALIGVNAPNLGGMPAVEGSSLAATNGILYIHGVGFVGNLETHGLRCDGSTIWLQRSAVGQNEDYGVYGSGPCDLTLHESVIFSNNGGGVRALGGSLRLDNTAVGINGDGSRGPGLNLQLVDVEIIYSTIVGNDGTGSDSIHCIDATGEMRNSIVVGPTLDSVELDCFPLNYDYNAIDTSGFTGPEGTLVTEVYNPNWFQDDVGGDFRLAAPPLTPFGDTALWVEGDPPVDADGTDRPTDDAPGYAGIDEP